MILINSLLAQTQQWTNAHSLRLLMVIGGLIVAVIALGIVMLVVRRRLFAKDSAMSGDQSIMEQLRSMHKRGDLTEEEYDAARRTMAAKIAKRTKKELPADESAGYAEKMRRGARAAGSGRSSAMPDPPSAAPRAQTALPGYDLTGEPLPTPKKEFQQDSGGE